MPGRLRRSRSRLLTDVSNLTQPRTPSPTKAALEKRQEQVSPPSPVLDLPEFDEPPFVLSGADDLADETDPPFPFRSSFESRQWKECTPILDDPVGEALAEQSLTFSRLPSGAFSQDNSFTATNGIEELSLRDDDEVFESPEKCRQRSHSWHALNTAAMTVHEEGASCARALNESDDLDIHELDASSEYSSSPPSSLSNHDEWLPQRSGEDSDDSVSTPNTSVPLSPPHSMEVWEPSRAQAESEGCARGLASPIPQQQTSTPPRPTGLFVELIETCPTPPSAAQDMVAEAARHRSLLTASGLANAESSDDEEGDGELPLAVSSSRSSSRAPSRSRSPSSCASACLGEAADSEQRDAAAPNLGTYSSSAYPDAAHFDTYTRRPRLRRSCTRIFASGDDALAFPSPADIVATLLAYPDAPASASTAHLPPPPAGTEDLGAPAPLRHLRPLSTPGWDHPPSSARAQRRSSAASRAPFSSLLPQPLRYQPSSSTLFSYDLAHLPAPDTPREQPFRVRWREVLRPTVCLGGGRGSGRYGDVWGAVERQAGAGAGRSGMRRPTAAANARSKRRWSLFGAPATLPEEREAEDAQQATRTLAPEIRLAEFTVPAAPERSAGGGLSRAGSFASVRQGLKRLGRRMSWAPSAADEDGTSDARERKARRRRSLRVSLFGVKDDESSVEDLEQWVAVVVR